MHKYMYHCKNCGYHQECSTKLDWALEKQDHKKTGCQLEFAPHKDLYILARPELAGEARMARDLLVKEKQEEEEKKL